MTLGHMMWIVTGAQSKEEKRMPVTVGTVMWLVTAFSIVGTVANVLRKRWCFGVWLLTNLSWCAYDASIAAWLREHNYDGLCGEECGCGRNDLFPAGACDGTCVPAHSRRATAEDASELGCDEGDIIYQPREAGKEAGE